MQALKIVQITNVYSAFVNFDYSSTDLEIVGS